MDRHFVNMAQKYYYVQGKRGVWLKILQEQADLVPIAVQVTIP